ncbi:DUF2254 domain-containing protein [Sphingomonadaceae bacterium OTU29LAMAA1]|nr:DUF2254 domain-containing protein [Sphingomonadaceae bacterium OTU29LAMAA1]
MDRNLGGIVTGGYLAGKGAYLLQRLTRQIWLRASLFSIAGVLTALVAAWLAPVIPDELSLTVGGKAVDNILTILASSMLAVTTFALSAAVTAYGAATSTVTPRATQLLIADRFTQNALSTFVGTFLFSIVGIIALTTGFYGDKGRVVLFFASVVIVAIIAITLLRWIQHLSTFGRVQNTIERVERAALEAMTAWAEAPCLGGTCAVSVPADAVAVCADGTGYVGHIDMVALCRIATRHDLIVHVATLPGSFVHPARPVARIEGRCDESLLAAVSVSIADAFSIQPDRNFDQDPRFGLIVLAEIASRALSPAVNDPGTAIRVIGGAHRVLAALVDTPADGERRFDRVHVPDLDVDDLFVDAFRPIARDGAGVVEVQLRLQATLAALADHAPSRFGAAARAASRSAMTRAEDALDADDVATLRSGDIHRG